MDTQIFKFTVDQPDYRLDKFLAVQVPSLSRSKIKKDIEAGAATIDGRVITNAHLVVEVGSKVSYQPIPIAKPQPVNMPLKVLYQNDGLMVIDKPAGVAVHPGAGFTGDTISQALQFSYPEITQVGQTDRPGIIHRLDKQTSGALAVALNTEMYNHLKTVFKRREVGKYYLALVCGRLQPGQGFIEKSLGKSKRDFRKMTTVLEDMVKEKPSKTEYRVLEYLGSGVDEYSLIVVKLHTGRTHQIRVHFNSLGFPLVGDSLYGGKRALRLGFKRQALHAQRLEIPLPDGTLAEAVSPLSIDLKQLLIKLGSQEAHQF